MIHPTRTNLLRLKEHALTVAGSIGLLKGRRQALLREFLQATVPLLRTRERLALLYAEALLELERGRQWEGESFVGAAAMAAARDLELRVAEGNFLGLRYREVSAGVDPRRTPWQREYDYRGTTPHLEEAVDRGESIVAEMLALAAFEGKVKRLGDELLRLTRRIRVLEERVLPTLRRQMREIARFLGEREREAYFRLKLFKAGRLRQGGVTI
ncbi:MAG: ATPase [Desulfuromonadales bacterium GWD2_61_12]|nr:MAG: ATPase [Desulfuromonadales bacterium GWC2_61_20]OGR34799.1 MAG: ATPase [Desulfuromonadales bacterium GWD2_61_12]HBT82369.1 V-type ATP synthase subunit D [Desulfuromonas sp.]